MHWYNQPHFNLVVKKDSKSAILIHGNIRVKIISACVVKHQPLYGAHIHLGMFKNAMP